LIRELINHLLQIIDRNLGFIMENMVVDRACSALNGGVGAEVEVILEGVSDIRFDESARKSVGISVGSLTVSILGEESDVMALCANDDSPLDLY
jgi:hypothetical protein